MKRLHFVVPPGYYKDPTQNSGYDIALGIFKVTDEIIGQLKNINIPIPQPFGDKEIVVRQDF